MEANQVVTQKQKGGLFARQKAQLEELRQSIHDDCRNFQVEVEKANAGKFKSMGENAYHQEKDAFVGIEPKEYVDNEVCGSVNLKSALKKYAVLCHFKNSLGTLKAVVIVAMIVLAIALLRLGRQLCFLALIPVVLGIIALILIARLNAVDMDEIIFWILDAVYGGTSPDYSVTTKAGKEYSANRAGYDRESNVDGSSIAEMEAALGISADRFSSMGILDLSSSKTAETGFVTSLQAEKAIKRHSSDGQTSTTNKTVFNGTYLVVNTPPDLKELGISTVKIDPISKIGRMVQDTVSGLSKTFQDFSFNTEELNDVMVCRISFLIFKDRDATEQAVQSILTPRFEEFLYALYKRYGAFHLRISESGVTFAADIEENEKKLDEGINLATDLIPDAALVTDGLRLFHFIKKDKGAKSNFHFDIAGDKRAYKYAVNGLTRPVFTNTSWQNWAYGKLLSSIENLFVWKSLGYFYNFFAGNKYVEGNENSIEEWEADIGNYIDTPYADVDNDWDDDLKKTWKAMKPYGKKLVQGKFDLDEVGIQ